MAHCSHQMFSLCSVSHVVWAAQATHAAAMCMACCSCLKPVREARDVLVAATCHVACMLQMSRDWTRHETPGNLQAVGRLCCRWWSVAKYWKAIGDRLQAPSYLSRVDHYWKIGATKQKTDVGKYSFVNRTITDWNQLPEEALGTSLGKPHIFRRRVRKVMTSEVKWMR
jgi:hypothetical protein